MWLKEKDVFLKAVEELHVHEGVLVYVLNVFLLHSCYQAICPAGEENGKAAKPSRFAFVNRLNQKFDEKSAKALQENLDYRAEKQKRREERKKNRHHKK